ncbi:hypothetical protein KIN20_018008 [Parelaphostrongylus tenuis]|uniref:Uncharacterized protein n=1 Tax=Parelaphostrongylus tenuis TaxID=148309 RepID=A0AAD5N0K6_PARTN|nr:hypothetical protein KIN20_018008 [Parelaphostrongylus tenuis]
MNVMNNQKVHMLRYVAVLRTCSGPHIVPPTLNTYKMRDRITVNFSRKVIRMQKPAKSMIYSHFSARVPPAFAPPEKEHFSSLAETSRLALSAISGKFHGAC